MKFLEKLFGDRHSRDMKKVNPLLDAIKSHEPDIEKLTDDGIKKRVQDIKVEIRERLQPLEEELENLNQQYHLEANEDEKDRIGNKIDVHKEKLKQATQDVLDDFLPEVFAIIRSTCKRLTGHEYDVRGNTETWHMVPFDVQLIGGIALHNGNIAEMATGEGKTLVATLPLFLNALTGRGCHLITVNDYLAQRDSEWMTPIFEYHDLSVGCIINDMAFADRQEAYKKDITYGTNSEFGFDYLRDNMAVSARQLVQRDLYYAIVDEVDSVLVDEARTPLIISGPVAESKNFYTDIRASLKHVVDAQDLMLNRIASEIRKGLESDDYNIDDIGRKLLTVKRGAPKNKQFMKLMKDSYAKKLVSDFEGYYLRDKKMPLIDEQLFYVIDEHAHSADLCEKGRDMMSKYDRDLFVMETLDELLERVDKNDRLTFEEKDKERNRVTQEFMDKSERLHNISQLLKAHALFEKDVDYVVQDNKVMIVDEFTGRLMPGRRFSDGLHQALEAKENVKIEDASQTLATITYQNFFRMYDKLAGMTGTAVTEEAEFAEIYNLPVKVIPTHMPITRIDYDDMIYLTKLDKYKAIIDEIKYWHEKKKPVLVGTVSVDVSEILARLLRREGIKHEVLNAKQHEREAEIVKFAGEPGTVTIATNMAGRGTDIKLGKDVVTEEKEFYQSLQKKMTEEYPLGRPVDGLHVIGTERHESRRIDRQLRGRAGRQGDPGTSRFYLSLEDDLMRLFGSDRVAGMMKKIGIEEGQAITHPWMTGAVEKAQKKVEEHNFNIRKNLIKYDEVMNQQREVIYSFRRNVLKGYDLQEEIKEMIREVVRSVVEGQLSEIEYQENWKYDRIVGWFKSNFGLEITEREIIKGVRDMSDVTDNLIALALRAYQKKEEILGADSMRELERRTLLIVVDEQWRDHLHEMDLLKEGVGLRAYANKDPLIEYKKEGYELFRALIERIHEQVAKRVFTTYIVPAGMSPDDVDRLLQRSNALHRDVSAYSGTPAQDQPTDHPAPPRKREKIQPRHVGTKVGMNDPCPCGSGKKYKKCCGKVAQD